MALSPNYGFPEPDNSSLVKNGAQDIRALGDAVDTAVWNVGYGQAGKNKIINGDFAIWQRGTSFTLTSGDVYTADRWQAKRSGANLTVSRQSFTLGAAPVAGYESQYFMRVAATTADDNWGVDQSIEDVRTFAGQTITISFWAKADTARTLNVYTSQDFNAPTGGSAAVTSAADTKTLTTSWQRFTSTVTLASIAGKTLGTGATLLNILFRHPVNSTGQFDIWGVQVEYGAKASPFQTASGNSPQAELAMCQRYYQVIGSGAAGGADLADRVAVGSSFLVSMRSVPTLALVGQVSVRQRNGITTATSPTVATYYRSTTGYTAVLDGFAGLTAGSGLVVAGDTGSNGNNTFTLSAEL